MLEVQGLSKDYGNGIGIFKISFQVQRGEVVGVLGANGSGKTTTFRILLGLLASDEGVITFQKQPLQRHPSLFGYLPEERSLLKDLKVKEHVWFLASLKKMEKEEFEREYEKWKVYFQLEGMEQRKVGVLSKGNQQKVQLLCAIIHRPKILIFDEPFSGLDLENQQLFCKLIKDLKQEGKYIILSTHNFMYLEAYCQQIICINKGKITKRLQLNQLTLQHQQCFVLHHADFHVRLIEDLDVVYWYEDQAVWIQGSDEVLKELVQRCLYYEIHHFEYGVIPMRKYIEEAIHG